MRWVLGVMVALGLGLLLRAHLVAQTFSADASGHYTDHLRHMGEALIFEERGFDLYRKPYGELTPIAGPPCNRHMELFPERTAPYPPLGILTHWPLARLERGAVLSAQLAHEAMVWQWTLVALLGCAVLLALLKAQPPVAQAWALLCAFPLLIGAGINGFFDVGYLTLGALGCLQYARQRPALALWCLAGAAALHFRAAVFLPLAVAAAVAHWRTSRSAVGLVLPALLVIPTLAAAFTLMGSLETIPADNPVHYSHVKLALGLLTVSSLATGALLWREGEPLVAVTLACAFGLAILERSHGWWHAGVLLAPGLVLASRPPRAGWSWALVLGWTVASAYLAYRHAFSPFWQWVPFALFGVS